jgi:hypothetical protein
MTRPTFLCLVVCLGLAIFVAYSQSTTVHGEPAADAAPSSDEKEIFKDNIVLLEFNSPAVESGADTAVLSGAHIAKIGQREFILGEGYAPEGSEEDWFADMTIGVPCDAILRLEAMTPERYKEYLKASKENAE